MTTPNVTDLNGMLAGLRRLQRGEPAPPLTADEIEMQEAEIARYQQWEDDTYGTAEDNYDGSP